MSKIKSYTDRSGMKTTHYDDSGNKIGESWSSPGGQVRHYDANGNLTGRSFTSPSGHMTHYDANYQKTGHSQILHSGHVKHYDTDYNQTGESHQNFWEAHVTQQSSGGGNRPSTSGVGCATLLFLAGMLTLLIYTLI